MLNRLVSVHLPRHKSAPVRDLPDLESPEALGIKNADFWKK